MPNIGSVVKSRRISLGLTQEELAKKIGYSTKSTITKVERGDIDLTIARLKQFAKALECKPGDLIDMMMNDKSNNSGTIIENNGSGDGNNSNNVTHTTTHNHYYDNEEDCTKHIIVTENTKKYFLGIIDNIRDMNDDQLLEVLKYTDFINKKEK